MSKPLDHENVSASLPAFLEGTLDPVDADAIEQHLASCPECSQEVAGLRFLLPPDKEGLTSSERTALEHRVMAGIAEAPTDAPVVELQPRRGVGARLAQVLGAAAAIAVFGTLLYLGSTMGGADDVESAGTASEAEDGRLDDRRSPDRGRSRPAAIAAGTAPSQEQATDATAGGGGSSPRSAPQPTFAIADEPYTAAGLQKLGESSIASVTFANSYSAQHASRRNRLLEQLVAAAEATSGSIISSQVEECGTQVLATDDPTIPTFGGVGELDGQPVLVLGFAWTRERSGPLDRYMVWAWERGSCSTAVEFVDGRIEAAD